ncbi:MAG: hypothetical protein HQK76_19410 [Desulfobacterales bacterium]|nr:hypothetical protein [Desulfobacterales bacterium]
MKILTGAQGVGKTAVLEIEQHELKNREYWEKIFDQAKRDKLAIELIDNKIILHQRITKSGKNLFKDLINLYIRQKKVNIERKLNNCNMPIKKEFFKISEEGNTVDYAIFFKNLNKQPMVFKSSIPEKILDSNIEIILIQNSKRSKRPGSPGSHEIKRVTGLEDSMSVLRPDNILKNDLELILEWTGGHMWWLCFNPFPIWPNKWDDNDFIQPFHCTCSRSDTVDQSRVNEFKNIKDLLLLFQEINNSEDLKGQRKFRLGVNGWYSSLEPSAPKAGASQSQLHTQLIRFIFPIENAETRQIGCSKDVNISVIDDFGTGIVLETFSDSDSKINHLALMIHKAIGMIIDKGDSYNLLFTPSEPFNNNTIRIFLADRIMGTPSPLFTNEWGFSEFGRSVVIDDPVFFNNIINNEGKNQFKNATKLTLAPKHQLFKIAKRLLE